MHHLLDQQLSNYCRSVIIIYVSLIVVVGLFGVWSVLPLRNKSTGLEGTWSNTTYPRYSYEFRSNGIMDVRCHGSRVKLLLTWARTGDEITVTTKSSSQNPIEEWTFKGQLRGKMIRGIATSRTPDNTGILSYDEVWVRDQAKETVNSEAVPQKLAIT